MRYWWLKKRESFVIWFWWQVPKSWLYWAVNGAWARATCLAYMDKHPDDVTFSMMQKFLSGGTARVTGVSS